MALKITESVALQILDRWITLGPPSESIKAWAIQAQVHCILNQNSFPFEPIQDCLERPKHEGPCNKDYFDEDHDSMDLI